jgi:hypothetical protein
MARAVALLRLAAAMSHGSDVSLQRYLTAAISHCSDVSRVRWRWLTHQERGERCNGILQEETAQ